MAIMQIVTITTDLSANDYALAALKGCLLGKLSAQPALQLVDIAHGIPKFDIVAGAFALGGAWQHFPQGTIHLVWLNMEYAQERRFLAFAMEGHYFVGPDNGFFSLLFPHLQCVVFKIEHSEDGDFKAQQLYAFAAEHIAAGRPLEQIGEPVHSIRQAIALHPVTGPDFIRGVITHVDGFGNVVTNVSRRLFESVGQGRGFILQFKRHEPLRLLSKRYSDVPVGEALCLFNHAGYLEIAVYMGRATALLGLEMEDMVELRFW